jgi:hypothetical protein
MTTTPPGTKPRPAELTVSSEVRDGELTVVARTAVRFIYDTSAPYTLRMDIYDPNRVGWEPWTTSREAFMAAALWGLALPGLDLTVTPVIITRAFPGRPTREVPCVRVAIYETDFNTGLHTGTRMYLDIEAADLRPYLTRLAEMVPVGHETGHLNMDETIARLLGRDHRRRHE